MPVVEKSDPRKKLLFAVAMDVLCVLGGIVAFLTSGSILWLLLLVLVGAGVSAPLIISAMRELREQNNASG